MIELLPNLRWNDLADMVLVSLLLWVSFVWLRRSRARLALVGIGFLAALYLLARRLELQLTTWILQGFFAALVIVVVVVFQEDLRRLFEQIAVWGLRRRPPKPPASTISVLVRTVALLARQRTGALIVVPGRAPLDRHLDGGIELDARFSSPLLLSLFDHHSPGHDGAVILHGDRIQRFAVHLPLSSDQREVGVGGTRHAAALGLAELTDALCIVVSEERGTVSVARDGHLRMLDKPEGLASELEGFLGGQEPSTNAGMLWARVARRWREALAALATAGLLWGLLVGGSGRGELTCEIPVEVQNLPPGFELDSVDPPQVEIVLGGPRHLLLLGEPEGLHLTLDAFLVQLGRRTFQLNAQQITLPPDLEVKSIEPRQVRLSVIAPAGASPAPSGGEIPPPAPPPSSEEEKPVQEGSASTEEQPPDPTAREPEEAGILQSPTVESIAT
jgi:uncharacterized protein (TIGR00159 family)